MAERNPAVGAMIPDFDEDSLLPPGVHKATATEVVFRFGTGSAQRRKLAMRLRRLIELLERIGVRRILLNGSFVTAEDMPKDLDAVMMMPPDFTEKIATADPDAARLNAMFRARRPDDLFAVYDEVAWNEWVEFFTRTNKNYGHRKGIVEVEL